MRVRLVWGALLALAPACSGGSDYLNGPIGAGDVHGGDTGTAPGDAGAPADAEGDAGGEDAAETSEDATPFVPSWGADPTEGLGEEFVLRGVWGSGPNALVAVGNKATIIEYHGAKWEIIHQNTSLDTLNGVWGSSMDDVWAVGAYGAILHRTAAGWGLGTGCQSDAACEDGNPCHQGKCGLDGTCVYLPTGAPGCCGTDAYKTGWDDGTLGGWTVQDTSPAKSGMVWNVTSHTDAASGQGRWTSPAYALYFGDPAKPCPSKPTTICFDNGNVVSSTVTSAPITLPEAAEVTATFQVFIDTESSTTYDALELDVVIGGSVKPVWTKAEVPAIPTGGFVAAKADLTAYAGQTVQLRFTFNSADSFGNDGEGVYIDDLVVSSQCGGAGSKAAGFPTLWGVWGSGSDDVYAVGNEGTILHWDGKSWKRQLGGQPRDLYGIGGSDASVVAVGAAGEAFSSFGGGFGTEAIGTPATMRSVALMGGQDAWAVGDGGTIARHEDSGWKLVPSGTTANLKRIWTDGQHLVAVGAAGTVLRNDGAGWTKQETGETAGFNGVWGSDGSDVYAVAEKGLLYHSDGATWEKVGDIVQDSGKTALQAIHGFGKAGPILVVGGGGWAAINKDGVWSKSQTKTTYVLNGVWGADATEAWAVGNLATILRWDGEAWTQVESQDVPTKSSLYDVWGRAKDDVYAVGAAGVLLHWDGKAWTLLRASTSSNLRAVWGLGPSDVYAVGAGATIMHFNGLYWTQVKVEDEVEGDQLVPVTAQLFDVWAAKPDDVWAVGAGGTMIHLEVDDTTGQPVWRKKPQENTISLRGLWGYDAEHMWATGLEGAVFRFDGNALEREDTGSIATLYDLIGFGSLDALVGVGDLGTVLRYTAKP